MKSLSVRIISTIISVPVLIIIGGILDSIVYPELRTGNENLATANPHAIISNFILAYIYVWPVYLVLGIPVSYLVDYLTGKTNIKTIKKIYCFKLASYIFICILLLLLLYEVEFMAGLQLIVIPVLIGFHVLYLLRREFKAKYHERYL